jgi:N-acetylglutamate synthase-like GNAT family acetyltransferase
MEKRESAKVTGMSEITGKVVSVRHATEADIGFIEETMKKHHFDTATIHYSEFVVATENGTLIGFARLKKTGGIYEVGCIIVIESKRGRGIGQLMVEHLIEHAPVDRVYVMTDWVDYFKKFGFVEMKDRSKEYSDALDLVCREGEKGKKVLMAFDKSMKK